MPHTSLDRECSNPTTHGTLRLHHYNPSFQRLAIAAYGTEREQAKTMDSSGTERYISPYVHNHLDSPPYRIACEAHVEAPAFLIPFTPPPLSEANPWLPQPPSSPPSARVKIYTPQPTPPPTPDARIEELVHFTVKHCPQYIQLPINAVRCASSRAACKALGYGEGWDEEDSTTAGRRGAGGESEGVDVWA